MDKTKKRLSNKLIIIFSISLCVLVFLSLIYAKKAIKETYEIDIQGGSHVKVDYNSEFKEPKINAYYEKHGIFGKKEEMKIIRQDEIDTSELSTQVINYRAVYKDKTKDFSLEVEVVDREEPVISLVSNPESFTNPNDKYIEEGFTATDNYDGDLTEKVEREEKDGVVTYKVKDSSGNEAVVTRNIVYKDAVPPIISLENNETVRIIKINDEYKPSTYSATDDCDGDITDKVLIEGNVDNTVAGAYELKYSVSDSSGNEAVINQTIYVSQGTTNNDNKTDPGEKVIYLTFDDGPGPYTMQLLDILDKYNVKVTFFVTATNGNYLDCISEEQKRGHTVAVHTYTHNYQEIYSSDEAFLEDMNKMAELIKTKTGVAPTIMRFPGGSSNTVSASYNKGIMSRLTKTVESLGYQYCDWNVSSGDAGEAKSADAVFRNVISGVQRNSRSSIVLQHDIKGFSVNAVERIIQWGIENGYTFLPMTNETLMSHHGINN